MGIEIKELVIKAVVNSGQTNTQNDLNNENDKSEIIRCCVEEVMNILRRERER